MSITTLAPLDRFMPNPDVRGRHQIAIHAPAEFVMGVARDFEIESLFVVRALFRLRASLLNAPAPPSEQRLGLVAQMQNIGWQCLAQDPSHFFLAGAACRPWQANPAFSPIAAENFTSFAEPDLVKIAWTLEAEELAPALTRFATETRVVSTDAEAHIKFRR